MEVDPVMRRTELRKTKIVSIEVKRCSRLYFARQVHDPHLWCSGDEPFWCEGRAEDAEVQSDDTDA